MTRKSIFISIGIGVGLLLVAGFFVFSGDGNPLSVENKLESNEITQNNLPETPERGEVVETQSGAKEYRSEPYGFAFQVPADFTVGEFDESGGRLLLVKSGGGTDAFQVFILPWDEPTESLTPERIKQDVPDLEIHDPQQLPMSGGASALTFIGESERFGTTREVWMVNDGWLFQVISAASDQEALQQILNTWRFI